MFEQVLETELVKHFVNNLIRTGASPGTFVTVSGTARRNPAECLSILIGRYLNQFSIYIQNVSVRLSDMYFLHNRTESGTSNL